MSVLRWFMPGNSNAIEVSDENQTALVPREELCDAAAALVTDGTVESSRNCFGCGRGTKIELLVGEKPRLVIHGQWCRMLTPRKID